MQRKKLRGKSQENACQTGGLYFLLNGRNNEVQYARYDEENSDVSSQTAELQGNNGKEPQAKSAVLSDEASAEDSVFPSVFRLYGAAAVVGWGRPCDPVGPLGIGRRTLASHRQLYRYQQPQNAGPGREAGTYQARQRVLGEVSS